MNARSGIGNWAHTGSPRSKSSSAAAADQEQIIFDEGKDLSTKERQQKEMNSTCLTRVFCGRSFWT